MKCSCHLSSNKLTICTSGFFLIIFLCGRSTRMQPWTYIYRTYIYRSYIYRTYIYRSMAACVCSGRVPPAASTSMDHACSDACIIWSGTKAGDVWSMLLNAVTPTRNNSRGFIVHLLPLLITSRLREIGSALSMYSAAEEVKTAGVLLCFALCRRETSTAGEL